MPYKQSKVWSVILSTKIYSVILVVLTASLIYLLVGEPALSEVFKKVVVVEKSNDSIARIVAAFAILTIMILLSFIYIKNRRSLNISGYAKAISEHSEVEKLVKAFYAMVKTIEGRDRSLEAERERAINANKAKTDFLLNISHELRTPMHAILNFAELGQQKISAANADKLKLYFSRIEESGERLLIIINSILDLTMLESGKVDLEFEMHNLEKCVQESINSLASLLDKKNLKVEIINKSNVKDWVIDKPHIMQVIVNLLSNAIKFSPDGKKISVLLEEIEGCAYIRISDEGVGVPDNEIDLIFDKFMQSSITTSGAGGSGIGLSICREIVDLHGGKIWAKNNKDCGVTFIFTIPKNSKGRVLKKMEKTQ